MKLLKGREILAIGTWPASEELPVTEEVIDGIVDAFNALNCAGRVPLKLSHDGEDARFEPLSKIAMGWVQKIWRKGKTLLADLSVPDKVAPLIDQEHLKFVSVELLKNVQVFNRTIPYVLDAIALLGAEQPAVGVLSDLKTSIMARRMPLRAGGRVTLRRADTSHEDTEMDKAEIEKLVKDQAAALVRAGVEAATGKDSEMGKALAAANAALDEERKSRKEDARKQHVALIDERFNRAIEAKAMEPATREAFKKLTRYDTDPEVIANQPITNVEEYVKDHSKKVEAKRATKDGAPDGDKDWAETVDAEFDRLIDIKCKDRGIKLDDAEGRITCGRLVMKDNPKLAKAYFEDPRANTQEALA